MSEAKIFRNVRAKMVKTTSDEEDFQERTQWLKKRFMREMGFKVIKLDEYRTVDQVKPTKLVDNNGAEWGVEDIETMWGERYNSKPKTITDLNEVVLHDVDPDGDVDKPMIGYSEKLLPGLEPKPDMTIRVIVEGM